MGDLIKRITSFKGIGFVVLALIAGVLLIVWPSNEAQQNKKSDNAAYSSSSAYAAAVEKKARGLIEQIEGVKTCDIMITLSDGYSYLYASNQRLQNGENNKDVEKQVVIITDDGKQKPIIICEYMPKIAGIAVVYDGDISVSNRIKSLLAVLFGLSDEYIYVTT